MFSSIESLCPPITGETEEGIANYMNENIRNVTIRTKPYCINKKSREIIRETFYNNKESSILFLQMGYLHEDFVVHT